MMKSNEKDQPAIHPEQPLSHSMQRLNEGGRRRGFQKVSFFRQ